MEQANHKEMIQNSTIFRMILCVSLKFIEAHRRLIHQRQLLL
jgi:hypothetical protein